MPEPEDAGHDPNSGLFLDAPPTWPSLPSNRARTYEWRCGQSRNKCAALLACKLADLSLKFSRISGGANRAGTSVQLPVSYLTTP